jgi:hypothetical protein
MPYNRKASPYSYYLDLLGEWPTGIALASQWLVYFDFNSVKALTDTFQTNLRLRESGSEWTYNTNVTQYLLDGKLQASVNNMIGCVFARQVVLPSESIDAGNVGLSYGGFQAPATSSGREKYQSFNVTFLETNSSFLDNIIRPWIVSVGYNGLVARPKSSFRYVKSNFADVVMYAKAGAYNPMVVRKIIRFYNVAPISLQGETYSHQEEGLRYSEIKFVYDKYAVLDPYGQEIIDNL